MKREDTNELMPQTQEIIQRQLDDMKQSISFMEFDHFLMERFLPVEQRLALQKVMPVEDNRETLQRNLSAENAWDGSRKAVVRNMDREELEKKLSPFRESAYRYCYQRIKNNCPVARATLRSWFHVGGSSRPSRSQMIAFAFALSLSVEELQEYFICGLQEPGIQINDYQEMIYCYGIEAGIPYEECQDMIEVFEREISRDTVLAQNTHTDELWSLYEEKKLLPKEDFLIWMCENGFYFKGYSKVALHCFVELKHEILEYIRGEAKNELFELLQDKGFVEWAAENQIPEEAYGKEIPRFLHNVLRRKNQYLIDEHTKEEITRLSWIVYSSKDKNSDLLAELYASAVTYEKDKNLFGKKKIANRKNFDLPESVYFMTDKYVSQLIGVAQQKEKDIRLSMARSCLMAEEPENSCPAWVKECMEHYGVWKNTATVGQTREVLDYALRQQKQRCQLVKRSDLLPLIHYVAQKRYEETRKEGEIYVQQDALDTFVALANQILSRCHMMELDDRYQLDYLFCATYGEQEMYSLSDMIEASIR